MNSSEHFATSFNLSLNEQTIVVLEIILVLGVIWLIFKKDDKYPNLNLSELEKEAIISAYRPESLVKEISEPHFALKPRIIKSKIGMNINVEGIECLNFSSNDFLGFIGDDQIEGKAMECINTYGVGSCGPRGFYGTAVEHLQLEKLLADFLEAEDAIVYSYGFATVASAIPAYGKKADIIFVDEKRNFSVQCGLDASRSEIRYFKHNDMKNLEEILESVRLNDLQNLRKARRSRRYLVVEGIYINTGNICPLPEIVKLCKKYKVRILIDESVSLGVLGKSGRGVTEYFGISRADVDLIMGSLEYALASVGGFCAGSRLLTDHQQISGQGYCFSASLPPLLAVAATEALLTVKDSPEKIMKLKSLCKVMHYKLNCSTTISAHFVISGDMDSPVHVLTLRGELEQYQQDRVINGILEHGLNMKVALTRAAYLPGIDVASVSASLRITTHIFNTSEHISYLVNVLEDACKKVFYERCETI